MTGLLLLAAVCWPFLLACGLCWRALRRVALRLAPWAALPGLAAALFLPGNTSLSLPWVFIGSSFALDSLARAFLLFSAVLWLAAGVYASGYLKTNRDPHPPRFYAFFLAAMGGNLALIPAQDMVSYIVFFAVMSFSAYGLVIHDPTASNRYAGRIYISMAVLGEMTAFAGLLWAAHVAGGNPGFAVSMNALQSSPHCDLIMLLLFIGFGIKLGIMPLHVWLPLAHPAAPTPASAVLSGVMIKTGLLLWLRIFPIGAGAEHWAGILAAVGLLTAFAGALAGMAQTHPKALLAYSSVSQMGLAGIAVGIGLSASGNIGVTTTAVTLFAAHHALAKGALFLGVGLAACAMSPLRRRALVAGLAVCGMSLAGFPMTSGMLGKGMLKYLAAGAETPWAGVLAWLLPLTGITTALLMFRFLWLIAPSPQETHGRWNWSMFLPWVMLALGVLLFPWLALAMQWGSPKQAGLYPAGLWKACWPVLAAAGIALAISKSPRTATALSRIRIPAGDLLGPVQAVLRAGLALFRVGIEGPARCLQQLPPWAQRQWRQHHGGMLQRMARYENFSLGMLLMSALALGMAWMIWF